MNNSDKQRKVNDLPGRFADLVAILAPRAVRDEVDYDNMIEMIDRLTSIPRLTKGQQEYLETMSVLVEAYERDHHSIETGDLVPRDILARLCEEHGMTASALGELLGNRSLGSKLLRGERELSKAHIRMLADRFRISADVLLDG